MERWVCWEWRRVSGEDECGESGRGDSDDWWEGAVTRPGGSDQDGTGRGDRAVRAHVVREIGRVDQLWVCQWMSVL